MYNDHLIICTFRLVHRLMLRVIGVDNLIQFLEASTPLERNVRMEKLLTSLFTCERYVLLVGRLFSFIDNYNILQGKRRVLSPQCHGWHKSRTYPRRRTGPF